jgi:uncharacterized protein with von Willebrand factor type A (vWA) domain
MADVLQGAGDVVTMEVGERCTWTDEDGTEQHCVIDDLQGDMVRIKFGRGEARLVEPHTIRSAKRRMVFQAPGQPEVRLAPSEDDLCYEVTKWPRMLWNEYCDHAPRKVEEVTKQGTERAPRWPDFMRELFARLLNPNIKQLDPATEGAEWARKSHGEAGDLPAWKRLVDTVGGDEFNAGLGAVAVAETLAGEMKPRESNVDMEEIQNRIESLKSMKDMGVDVGDRIDSAERELADAAQEAADLAAGMDATVIRNALRAACEAATEEIEATNKAINAFSYGTQPGAPVNLPMDARRKLAELIRNDETLLEIARKLGRLRRIADNKQHTKTDKARDEVHDVEQGADLDRLLPSEAMQLAGDDEALAANAFSKYTERRLLQYALRGKDKEGQGPIISILDESGSMSGDPDFWQKACCLALMDVAIRQKRSWAAVHHDSTVHRIDVYEKGEAYLMEYPHGSGSPTIRQKASVTELLLDTCTHFTGGGTSFDRPLNAAVQVIEREEFNRADIIMITDGNAPLSDKFVEDFLAVKARKEFKLYVVTVGACASPDALARIADEVWSYDEVMTDDDGFNTKAFGI